MIDPLQPRGDYWWMKMRTLLIFDEGMEREPYLDTTGNLTIGIGHNLTAKPLSLDVIYAILDEDIVDAITEVCKIFTQPVFDSWTDEQQYAITNMMFNLGPSRFSNFIHMIDAIKKGEWTLAAKEALDSKWASQVGKRAQRVVALFIGKNIYETN